MWRRQSTPGNDSLPTDEHPTIAARLPPTLIQHPAEADVPEPVQVEWTLPSPYAERFRSLQVIGQGGTGTVYAAYDAELDRMVALKALGQLPPGTEAREFARHEARMIAGLHHPGIVTLYDMIAGEGAAWLIMEYVDGPSLNDLLQQGKVFSPAEAAEICIQVCQALQYAHDRGIWHLDIKPGNVLMADGRVKVADFGIARRRQPEDKSAGWGTPGYAPPEQLSGQPTAESDVYAVGALLLALITGEASGCPAGGLGGRSWRRVPGALRPILRTAMAAQPSSRYSTPAALARALAAATAASCADTTERTRQVWDVVLGGLWGGTVAWLVSVPPGLALMRPAQSWWFAAAVAALAWARLPVALALTCLVLAMALLWHAPTLGVLTASLWPLLALCARAFPRPFLLALLTPLLARGGVPLLPPLLAGALLPTKAALGAALAGAIFAGALDHLLDLPVVQSYFAAAATALPMPTMGQQIWSIVTQISPRDLLFQLLPGLWHGALRPTTLWTAGIGGVLALGASWACEQPDRSVLAGAMAALLAAGELARVMLGTAFSGLGVLWTFCLAELVCEASPQRVGQNLTELWGWLRARFPSRPV